MAKDSSNILHIRVLQNGFPVAEISRKINKKMSFSLTGKSRGALSIPLYPLSEDIEVMRTDKKKAYLILDQPWSGFIASQGNVYDLKPSDRSEKDFRLDLGDYASIALNDLRLLIKIGAERKIALPKINPVFKGSIIDLFFREKIEKQIIILSALLTIMLGFSSYYIVKPRVQYRPQSFEQLTQTYTLPFIHPKNFETAPEALKENLNRKDYISSVVKFYRHFAILVMGYSFKKNSYIYESSVELFTKLYAKQKETIQAKVAVQTRIDSQIKNDKSVASLSIPSIYGESFQQRLFKIINTVNLMQTALEVATQQRKEISEKFRHDPAYDWSRYMDEKGERAAADLAKTAKKLATLAVFDQKNNEDLMYIEARDFAQQATKLQQNMLKDSVLNLEPLGRNNVHVIAIPSDFAAATFVHNAAFSTAGAKISQLTASKLAHLAEEEVKEPLVGKIDARALERTIEKNRYQLNHCYDFALRRNQSLAGEMDLSWRISSLGKISEISLVHSTIYDKELISCIKRKLAIWDFPKPKDGSIQVSHSFHFRSIGG